LSRVSPVQYSPRTQSRWVLTNYGEVPTVPYVVSVYSLRQCQNTPILRKNSDTDTWQLRANIHWQVTIQSSNNNDSTGLIPATVLSVCDGDSIQSDHSEADTEDSLKIITCAVPCCGLRC